MFNWVGEHEFELKATLGTYSATSGRGNDGLYNSVTSTESLTVTIKNPCVTSVVNSDVGLVIPDIEVPQNEEIIQVNYAGPTDSASLSYGNGYDKCGPIKYTLLDELDQPFSLANFGNSIVSVIDNADSLNFELQSFAEGEIKVANFTVLMQLEDYPESTPYE